MAKGGDGIGGIVKIGLIAGGAYLAYKWYTGQSTAPTVPAPTQGPTGATGATGPAGAPGASAASVVQLQAVYDKMVSLATAANMTSGNPDQWGFYLAQAIGSPAPDPIAAFPSLNRASNWPAMNSVQYWAGVGPLVASSHGLSGFAARMAGLGALVGGYGR